MKINMKITDNVIQFEELSVGDMFMFYDSVIFNKCFEPEVYMVTGRAHSDYNYIICLATGTLTLFSEIREDRRVVKVKGELYCYIDAIMKDKE